MRRADDPHGGGGAVLLVVGVKDEEDIESPREHGVRLETGLCDLPHHREEIRAEIERIVRIYERHPDAEAVGGSRQCRHLRYEPRHLLASGLRVEDVLGV